jgi:DNA-binding transcriptional LysR family regulator
MKISLRQLAHAEALARHGQFRDAALELHITQPALTRSIQALERALGGRLFDRRSGEVTPTRAGELVLEKARRVLPAVRELEEDTRSLLGLQSGSLSISTGPYPGYLLVPLAVSRVAGLYPGLSIRVREVDWTEVKGQLLDRESDIAVADISLAREDPRLAAEPLGQDQLFYFCRPGHPMANRDQVTIEDIRSYPLAGNKAPQRMTEIVGGHGRAGERDPVSGLFHPRIEIATVSALKQVVAASDAVGLCPLIFLEEELLRGELVLIPADTPTLFLDSGLLYLAGKSLSPASLAFMEAARLVRQEQMERAGAIMSAVIA